MTRTAVLWHSMLVDNRMWDKVAPAFAQSRYLLRISGPGHLGGPPAPRGSSLDDCVSLALATLVAAGVDSPVDWVGSGWGGHVGILLAAAHPDRVRSLAVFDTPLTPLAVPERMMMIALQSSLRIVGATRPIRRTIAAGMLADQSRKQRTATAYLDDCLLRADRSSLARMIGAVSIRRADLTPLSADLTMPTLFVSGEEDRVWGQEAAPSLRPAQPPRTVVTVPGARHLTPFEAPTATMDLVHAFWSRVD